MQIERKYFCFGPKVSHSPIPYASMSFLGIIIFATRGTTYFTLIYR